MKRGVLTLVLVFLWVLLGGCSADKNIFISESQKGYLYVSVKDSASFSGVSPAIISVDVSPIVAAYFCLSNESGWSEGVAWQAKSGETIVMNIPSTGTYFFSVAEIDGRGLTNTSSAIFTFRAGYNYYITVTLGGVVSIIPEGGKSPVTNLPFPPRDEMTNIPWPVVPEQGLIEVYPVSNNISNYYYVKNWTSRSRVSYAIVNPEIVYGYEWHVVRLRYEEITNVPRLILVQEVLEDVGLWTNR